MALYLGCPMWQHPDWSFQSDPNMSKLAQYSRWFSSVEGNTTFYHLPKERVASAWQSVAAEGFRFSFKFPRAVTHENKWAHCDEYEQFMRLMEGFSLLGPIQIQLPPTFSVHQVVELVGFVEQLPKQYQYAVEVRNLSFFAKDLQEQAFNRMLITNNIARTLFDTRPLFALSPDTEAIRDGHRKKPKVPLHVIATAGHVIVRYIGPAEFERNMPWFKPWLQKIQGWLNENRDVYLFVHTPDNARSPNLALDMAQAILGLPEGGEQLQKASPQGLLFST